jgi:hypothetical protein
VLLMSSDPRAVVQREADAQGASLNALSVRIGKNAGYLQQWSKRGTPRELPEEERRKLAIALNIDERLLGARDPWSPEA